MSWQLVPERTEVTCGDTLPFSVINHGPGLISFGLTYWLERYELGAWVKCELEGAVPAVQLGLRAGQQYELAADIPVDTPPGRYRVLKDVAAGCDYEVREFEFKVAPPSGQP